MPFANCFERVDHAARHQPEIAGVDRDRDFGQPLRRAVEEPRGPNLEAALALAFAAHGIYHVEAGLPALDHRRNQLGRILQIRIDQHDRIAARDVESRGRRELMAEVAREPHDDESRVGGGMHAQ